jgi:hypothetical protein
MADPFPAPVSCFVNWDLLKLNSPIARLCGWPCSVIGVGVKRALRALRDLNIDEEDMMRLCKALVQP